MIRPPVENRPRPLTRSSFAQPARHALAIGLLSALALLASACSGGNADEAADNPNIINAGQIGQIQLPDDDPPAPPPPPPAAASETTDGETADTADDETNAAADTEAAEEPAEDEEDEDAIPLADDDQPAILGLIDAFDDLNSCLEREGFEFIGVPGQDGPPEDFPAGYPQSLGTCAASSNIVQAIQDSAAENAELSPEEIEERNEAYFVFESCLKDQGWNPADPVPDEFGVLLAEDGDLGPPDNVDDPIPTIRECASRAAAPLLEAAEDS